MIKYDNYFASELEKHAIAITQYQHPKTTQLGDVNNVDFSNEKFKNVDLLLAGSPCTSFSVAGKRDGFKAESGQLFFRFIDALKTIKPKYFLLENVKMSKDNESIMLNAIREHYPSARIHIVNSALKSAQNRVRMYITNIPFDPSKLVDEGIILADILEEDGVSNPMMTNKDGKSHCLTARYNGAVWWNSIERKQRTMVQVGETAEIKGFDILKRVYSPSGKSPTLTTMQGGHREPKVATYDARGGRIVNRRLDANGVRKDYQLDLPFTKKIEVRNDRKTNCLTTIEKDNIVVDDDGLRWRKLLPTECESLQTLPTGYTAMGTYPIDKDKNGYNFTKHTKPVAKSNRYKAIGNGWTVSIINEIFKGIDGDLRDVMSLFDGISCGQQALKTTERS